MPLSNEAIKVQNSCQAVSAESAKVLAAVKAFDKFWSKIGGAKGVTAKNLPKVHALQAKIDIANAGFVANAQRAHDDAFNYIESPPGE